MKMQDATAIVIRDGDCFIGVDAASGGCPFRTKRVLDAEHFPDTSDGHEKASAYKSTMASGSNGYGASQWVLCRMKVTVEQL